MSEYCTCIKPRPSIKTVQQSSGSPEHGHQSPILLAETGQYCITCGRWIERGQPSGLPVYKFSRADFVKTFNIRRYK